MARSSVERFHPPAPNRGRPCRGVEARQSVGQVDCLAAELPVVLEPHPPWLRALSRSPLPWCWFCVHRNTQDLDPGSVRALRGERCRETTWGALTRRRGSQLLGHTWGEGRDLQTTLKGQRWPQVLRCRRPCSRPVLATYLRYPNVAEKSRATGPGRLPPGEPGPLRSCPIAQQLPESCAQRRELGEFCEKLPEIGQSRPEVGQLWPDGWPNSARIWPPSANICPELDNVVQVRPISANFSECWI